MITKFKLFEKQERDIFTYILEDDHIELRKYLQNGGNPNLKTSNGMFTLVEWINIHNAVKCAQIIVESDIDINVNILIDAILEKRMNMIDIFYDSININDIDDRTFLSPLLAASYMSLENLIIKLIEDGADWNYQTPKNIFIIRKTQDFLDVLKKSSTSIYYYIIDNYPEKYENYLRNKEIKKFKI